MSIYELMFWPFLECLILVGIHSYLGIHVLKRKVIFVDLAFAQIAALGTTVAFLFGLEPGGAGAYVFSLIFAMVAAAVFAITRFKEERIPQEAIIGLTYALAASAAILVVDRAPHGAEHIKDIMAGSLLWVNGSDVLIAGALYAVIGIFHFIFRRQFLLISTDVDEARRQGLRVRLWDFLFYMSFGLVISLSVRVAGVLLVFVFLVVPAMLAMVLTSRLKLQLFIGWTMGTLVTVAGLALSNFGDFPAGPAVVTLYGAVLVVVSVTVYLVRSKDDSTQRIRRVLVGLAALLVVGGALSVMGRAMGDSPFWSARHDHEMEEHLLAVQEQDEALSEELTQNQEEQISDDAAEPVCSLLEQLLKADYTEKESLLEYETDVGLLGNAFKSIEDEETRLLVASRLHQVEPKSGEDSLLEFVREAEMPFMQMQAAEALMDTTRPSILCGVFEHVDDSDVQLQAVQKLADVAPLLAVDKLSSLLDRSEEMEVREQSIEILSELAGSDFEFDAMAMPDSPENERSLQQLSDWLNQRSERPGRGRFHRNRGQRPHDGRGKGSGRGHGGGRGMGRDRSD